MRSISQAEINSRLEPCSVTPSLYQDEIITEPFRVDAEGYLPIPTRPGLGVELNREAMKRFGC